MDARRQLARCWAHAAVVLVSVVLYTMFMWWRDVDPRGAQRRPHPVVQLHLRYGMILFIASEVMFFVAWFWAFFDAALFPAQRIQDVAAAVTGGQWPPKGIRPSIRGTCRCSTR